MKIITSNGSGAQKLYDRYSCNHKSQREERVRKIIDDIRANGDAAVLRYTRKFDHVKMDAKDLRVAESEISGAFQNITSDFISDLKQIINNVTGFYNAAASKTPKGFCSPKIFCLWILSEFTFLREQPH